MDIFLIMFDVSGEYSYQTGRTEEGLRQTQYRLRCPECGQQKWHHLNCSSHKL